MHNLANVYRGVILCSSVPNVLETQLPVCRFMIPILTFMDKSEIHAGI